MASAMPHQRETSRTPARAAGILSSRDYRLGFGFGFGFLSASIGSHTLGSRSRRGEILAPHHPLKPEDRLEWATRAATRSGGYVSGYAESSASEFDASCISTSSVFTGAVV